MQASLPTTFPLHLDLTEPIENLQSPTPRKCVHCIPLPRLARGSRRRGGASGAFQEALISTKEFRKQTKKKLIAEQVLTALAVLIPNS